MTKAEVKEILEKQLELLSEESRRTSCVESLAEKTHAMCELVETIKGFDSYIRVCDAAELRQADARRHQAVSPTEPGSKEC